MNDAELEQFLRDGFVRVDGAFSRAIADEARATLWRDTKCDPDDAKTWQRPVVWLGDYAQPVFREAVNTPRLHAAFDALVGAGRWLPRGSLGTFPVRFPSEVASGDDGWHVDASFPPRDAGPATTFFDWRINSASRGRALLMLFLFSDVGEDDAPTRLRIGSHHDVARLLAPYGDEGLSMMELAGKLDVTAQREEAYAVGEAGTVYLCHPLLVHAAQRHRGKRPRFLAQPPLLPRGPFDIANGTAPVERAIRDALDSSDT